jgi:hypothetical protein
MSLVFMSFAVVVFATHKNWKMLVTNETPNEKYGLGLVQQLAQRKEAIISLKAELDDIRNQLELERAARRHAIGALETKLAETSQRLIDKEAELRTLQAAEGVAAEALRLAESNAEELRKEVVGLRNEIRLAQADRDQQFEKVVQLTDLWNGSRGLVSSLEERRQQLLAQIADCKRVMDKVGVSVNMDVDGIPPKLDGIVTAVGERNLIEVSLGSDDGLRVGHRLEVFRSNAYLGHAIVLKTDPDRSVAKIDEESQKGRVEVRDRVATKLGRTRTG